VGFRFHLQRGDRVHHRHSLLSRHLQSSDISGQARKRAGHFFESLDVSRRPHIPLFIMAPHHHLHALLKQCGTRNHRPTRRLLERVAGRSSNQRGTKRMDTHYTEPGGPLRQLGHGMSSLLEASDGKPGIGTLAG